MAAVSVKYPLVWLLLWICVRLSETKHTRVSLDDDVLLPYARGHGPSHSHRRVRDCQSVTHGNATHEARPSGNHSWLPAAESTVFVSSVAGSSRWVYGHMTVVHDPLSSVSVLEPGGPSGCSVSRRASVEETAEDAGCLYAQNAGFFDTRSGKCLGNVVSDGRAVQDSGGVQNAQFGIRRDGSLVFGYLSQEDVLDQSNPFVQLVSGVVWLLRNGEVYINQSLKAECDETQETGKLRTFVDVVSARTAVGHDADGKLILFQIDGQTEVRGMNLWELADFLKSYGVVNAINLDGGGSSTYVRDGSLASYPSDHCESDSRWRCARPVSTVLCVHQRRCRPADCSGHGDCVAGRCRCQEDWQGAACDSLVCSPAACGPHGVCTTNGCVCDAGWRGENCSQECLPGFYGDGCNQTCVCVNGGSCGAVHGHCACPSGFHGNTCEQLCPLGSFGPSCAQECRCDDQCPCDPHTGSCNTTLRGETNNTVHRAGHCLAKQMFTFWRRDEEAHREQPRLTEVYELQRSSTDEGRSSTDEGRSSTDEGRSSTDEQHRRGSEQHRRGSEQHRRGSEQHRRAAQTRVGAAQTRVGAAQTRVGAAQTSSTDEGRSSTDEGRSSTDEGRSSTDEGRSSTDEGRSSTDGGSEQHRRGSRAWTESHD
ncbi:N-acetylglucosamine-1-phosphodiester alpha-N-acetylglucosaminidase-like isoform X2 [Cottoperca gobio]|uniref:N-acetylglucosamine-1-phosphodiester alpha-N-acetylglucosaminidase-like isoform X2 n=1 Tax=Cottoperca gobio TaxID=56716 RepID=A0A6J2RBQ6_COTGO|nr:N-acetylglucosamine-1-phosphodiester alpha-N-acetylglucosaminidase-like isoform X2 [Cottoperca gobio]